MKIVLFLISMQRCNPKVILIFFIKNILSTIYIVPIWWIGVAIFEKIWNPLSDVIPKEQIILLLNGVGIIYLVLLLVGCYYWAWLAYAHYSYALENDGLHIYHGVFFKRNTVIPYNYIEDLQVYANPFIVRFLGLYYLHIKTRKVENTSGILNHTSHEQLPGMPLEEINNLRSKLIASSHVLAVQPRKYFDPSSGIYH